MAHTYQDLLDHKSLGKPHRYDRQRVILYALGIGMGMDPLDERQLRFVLEDGLLVFPTFATVATWDINDVRVYQALGRQLEFANIQNAVGGAAAYQQLTGWAADNFAPAEIEAFDQVVESGNMGAINLALQALYYRYTDAMGYEGQMIQGKPARSHDVFQSQAEVVRAMSDRRYDRDPAYRQEVVEKLGRSDLEF